MNIFQWNFILSSKVFIQENAIENIVFKMSAILLKPQCVNFHAQQSPVFGGLNSNLLQGNGITTVRERFYLSIDSRYIRHWKVWGQGQDAVQVETGESVVWNRSAVWKGGECDEERRGCNDMHISQWMVWDKAKTMVR